MRSVVTRTDVVLRPDPSRVLARLFVPGHELLFDTESRATGVLSRILALPEEQVAATLARVRSRYAGRHHDLQAVMDAHYSQIEHRLPETGPLTTDRRSLIGAWFTQEFAVEGAALFNPSAVLHPDQTGLAAGEARFVLSLRAVGEGHVSSVEFRTGVLGPGASLRMDDPGRHLETGEVTPTAYDRTLLAAKLREDGADAESTRYLLGRLPARFDAGQLESALVALTGQRVTRHGGDRTAELARHFAQCSYDVTFRSDSALSERVLWPHSPSESHGLEDVRFVRFVADDGGVSYRATYTAFDGALIAPQLLTTGDFRAFHVSQLAGPAATNKGMALFPRTVGGRHLALSRWDRENTSVTTSEDGQRWGAAVKVHTPTQPWELIQTGNCGSPLETDAGWLVVTHGVGPMREYALGALLLDLDDPTRVIGSLTDPLMTVADDEREGYVPNVVYSCGALLHDDQLLLPYGSSDSSVRFAFVELPALLARLTGSPAATRVKSSA